MYVIAVVKSHSTFPLRINYNYETLLDRISCPMGTFIRYVTLRMRKSWTVVLLVNLSHMLKRGSTRYEGDGGVKNSPILLYVFYEHRYLPYLLGQFKLTTTRMYLHTYLNMYLKSGK